jgi:hypothetical protein
MDSRLIEALILLAIAAVGGLSTLIKVLVTRMLRELRANTTISTQARDASNGRLSEVLDKLAAARNQVVGLRWIVQERDDRLAYLVARLPEAENLMRDYRNQRTTRATAADEALAERHALDVGEDPAP